MLLQAFTLQVPSAEETKTELLVSSTDGIKPTLFILS